MELGKTIFHSSEYGRSISRQKGPNARTAYEYLRILPRSELARELMKGGKIADYGTEGEEDRESTVEPSNGQIGYGTTREMLVTNVLGPHEQVIDEV